MKKVIFIIVGLILVATSGAMLLSQFRQSIDSALSQVPTSSSPPLSPTPTFTEAKNNEKSIFVPYWGMTKSDKGISSYDELIYFGVTTTESGLAKNEDGYKNLPSFVRFAEDKKKHLTIRMIDSETNFAVLKDEVSQKRIIQESISLAREYGFDGIVLNLEVSALPFDSLIGQINTFNGRFYDQTKANNLEYALTAYGDTFFRVRPFAISELEKKSDRIFLMAYDFHKAKGNPGPNFPLKGNETYGYDFETMIDNFLEYLPPEKITVIFGMYGYDWLVDDENISQELASSLSFLEAKQKIVDNCSYASCQWQRDMESGEIKAEYRDSEEKKHIVWFEDPESVERKTAFLSQRGIGSISYWAYSYF